MDRLVSRIVNRGTDAAVTAVHSIKERLSDWWLGFVGYDAERVRLDAATPPPDPMSIVKLLEDSKARYVGSLSDFTIVVMEVLEEYGAALHKHLGAIGDLWDDLRDGTFRPKKETDFSSHLARYLRDNLQERHVVVNREVEVRERRGSTPGERTDILVQAPAHRVLPLFSIVIEVKGCWNPDAPVSMKAQLCERYLAEEPGAAGIYVVGYFGAAGVCAARCSYSGIEQCRSAIAKQAAELSREKWSVSAIALDTRLGRKPADPATT